jgi:drug/metabolite transporter (DMT)-like permease
VNRNATTALGGIAFVVLAGACFATLDTATKYVALSVPALMALWVRYMLQAVLSTAILLPMHGFALLRTRQPRMQLLRGLMLIGTTTLAFFSLQRMPVGEFTAIVMVAPLAVTVVVVTVFKERIAPLHWVFVLGGFAGTVIIVRPGGQYYGWGMLLPLGCMVLNTVFQLLSAHLGKTENPATTHFYSVWVGALLSSLALPIAWVMVDSLEVWLLMLLMGLMGAVGHFLLALAYQRAPAAILMPYLYCHVGFAVIGGWLVFAHIPDVWACAGIAMIATSGACSALLTARERRLPIVVLPQS